MARRATLWTATVCLVLLPLFASCGSQKEVLPPPPTKEKPAPAQETTKDTGAADVEKPVDPDAAYAFENIHFEFDKYRLTSPAQKILNQHAQILVRHPSWTVKIAGHCDERGTIEYNLALGEKRANAVRDYLISLGVPARQLRVTSYGENKPFAKGSDEGAWALNRRAHFARP